MFEHIFRKFECYLLKGIWLEHDRAESLATIFTSNEKYECSGFVYADDEPLKFKNSAKLHSTQAF